MYICAVTKGQPREIRVLVNPPQPIQIAELFAILFALELYKGDLIVLSDNMSAVKMLQSRCFPKNSIYTEVVNQYIESIQNRKIIIQWVDRKHNVAGKILEHRKDLLNAKYFDKIDRLNKVRIADDTIEMWGINSNV
jgi:hypothetical protein